LPPSCHCEHPHPLGGRLDQETGGGGTVPSERQHQFLRRSNATKQSLFNPCNPWFLKVFVLPCSCNSCNSWLEYSFSFLSNPCNLCNPWFPKVFNWPCSCNSWLLSAFICVHLRFQIFSVFTFYFASCNSWLEYSFSFLFNPCNRCNPWLQRGCWSFLLFLMSFPRRACPRLDRGAGIHLCQLMSMATRCFVVFLRALRG